MISVDEVLSQETQDNGEGKVVVELKALVNLEDVHIAQAKNFTVAYDFPLGLLLNFGSSSLQYKLMFNPRYFPKRDSANSKIQ